MQTKSPSAGSLSTEQDRMAFAIHCSFPIRGSKKNKDKAAWGGGGVGGEGESLTESPEGATAGERDSNHAGNSRLSPIGTSFLQCVNETLTESQSCCQGVFSFKRKKMASRCRQRRKVARDREHLILSSIQVQQTADFNTNNTDRRPPSFFCVGKEAQHQLTV
jgi:hypothetical protein